MGRMPAIRDFSGGSEVPDAVLNVHRECFPTGYEANIVAAVHADDAATVSIALEEGGEIIGHCLLSPVTLEPAPGAELPPNAARGLGLGPIGVVEAHRGRALGAMLLKAALDAAKAKGALWIVALGEPNPYRRAGFETASRFGLTSIYDSPDEAFMVLPLAPGALKGVKGLVKYHPAFGGA